MTDLRTLFGQARTNVRPADAEPTPAPMARGQERARIERDAGELPCEGPVHAIVLALDELLTALVELDAINPSTWARTRLAPRCDDPDAALDELTREPVAYALRASLHRLGWHAHRLTGGVDSMRAIHHKATAMAEDGGTIDYRRGVLDEAWQGIGDEHGAWAT